MKKSSLIIGIIMISMIIFILVFVGNKYGLFEKNNIPKIEPDSVSTEGSKANVNSGNESSNEASTDMDSLIDNVTYSIGESCETEEWGYCIKSVNVTKSGDGMDPYPNEYFPCNENGDFICDSSYVTVDMEVTNNCDEDRQLHMNSTWINLYNYDDGNKLLPEDSAEASAYTFNGERPIEARDFFNCKFKAGETKSFRVGHKIKDSYLDKTFDLVRIEINHSGIAGFTDKIRYYTIGENIKLKDISND